MEVEAVSDTAVPASHCVHAGTPTAALWCPGGQAWHTLSDSTAAVPYSAKGRCAYPLLQRQCAGRNALVRVVGFVCDCASHATAAPPVQ